jgi:hypothetical protein
VAPAEELSLPEAGAVLDWLEDDEPDEEPPQPATIRARTASESAATKRRGKDIDRLLIRWRQPQDAVASLVQWITGNPLLGFKESDRLVAVRSLGS